MIQPCERIFHKFLIIEEVGCVKICDKSVKQKKSCYQVVIAKWLAQGLATREVQGSNHSKGDNY